jgi:hypothetical protein
MNIQLQDYPLLRLLAWNLPLGASVDELEALSLYERSLPIVYHAKPSQTHCQALTANAMETNNIALSNLRL